MFYRTGWWTSLLKEVYSLFESQMTEKKTQELLNLQGSNKVQLFKFLFVLERVLMKQSKLLKRNLILITGIKRNHSKTGKLYCRMSKGSKFELFLIKSITVFILLQYIEISYNIIIWNFSYQKVSCNNLVVVFLKKKEEINANF